MRRTICWLINTTKYISQPLPFQLFILISVIDMKSLSVLCIGCFYLILCHLGNLQLIITTMQLHVGTQPSIEFMKTKMELVGKTCILFKIHLQVLAFSDSPVPFDSFIHLYVQCRRFLKRLSITGV